MAVDSTYQPSVYRKHGGNELVVASGGTITVQSGGTIAYESGAIITPADRVVTLSATTAITDATHSGKLLVMAGAGAARTFTLPNATGTGARFLFVVGTVNTSGYLIKSARGADVMCGTILSESSSDSATDAVNSWTAGATDDTITLDGTTTGGVSIGDWVEVCDIATNKWFVRGVVVQSGTEATPFSDTVT